MDELVKLTQMDDIAVITIDNPPVNALSPGVPEGIVRSVEAAGTDPAVRAIVIIGAGSTFIAGADIREFEKMTSGEKPRRSLLPSLLEIEDSTKPVVMAIHGQALGGGLEVAQAGHYRVITPSAQVGQPEVKLGIIPGYGGSQRLPRLCGKGVAHELILTGEMISAEEALRVGLVNRVVEPGELLATAEAIAKKIIANAPLAVKYALEAVERGMEMPQEEGLYLEATLFGLCCATQDMREGTRAFLEKRPPKFEGR